MNIKIYHTCNNFTLEVEGRLNTTNSAKFEEEVKQLYDLEHIELTVDVSKLTYISSSGLRNFIILLNKIKANSGKMIITNMSREILEIFEMTGFSNIFEIKQS